MIVPESQPITADQIVGEAAPQLGYQPPPRAEGGMIDSLRAKFAAAQNPSVDTEEAEPIANSEKAESKAEPVKLATPAELKKGLDSLMDDEEPAEEEEEAKEAEPEEVPPADVKTPEAKNAWSALKSEVKTLKAEKLAFEAEKVRLAQELEAAKKIQEADPVKKRAEELEAILKEKDMKLAKYDIRETEAYRRTISEPMEAARGQIARLAKSADLNVANIDDAIYQAEEEGFFTKMDEILETLPPSRHAALMNAATAIRELELKSIELEQNAKPALEEAKAHEKAETEKQRTERRASEMREITNIGEALKKAASLFKVDGESEDAAVKAVLDAANAVPFDEQDAKTKAFQTVAAELVPRMKANLKAVSDENAKLKRQIASLTGTTPRTTNGSPAKTSAPSAIPGAGDFLSAVRQRAIETGIAS